MKKSILIVSTSYPRWDEDIEGGGFFVHQYARQLVENYEVFVLAPFLKGSKESYIFDGVNVVRYKYLLCNKSNLINKSGLVETLRKKKYYFLQLPFLFISLLFGIKRIVKKQKIDLIHAFWILPNGLFSVLFKNLFCRNIKIIVSALGSDINIEYGSIGLFLKKIVLRNVDTITVVSKDLKRKLELLGFKKNLSVIPMGIDTQLFKPVDSEIKVKGKFKITGKLIFFIGVFNEYKGIRYLIEAMTDILNKYPDTKLLLSGTGIGQPEMIKLANDLKINNNVIFTGYISTIDLIDYYSAADVIVFPSLNEGTPIVMLEALSCGAILITSDIPVFKEHINEGINGFCIPCRSSKAIADKIDIIFSDYDRYRSNKQISRQYIIDNYDWKVIGEKFSDEINKLIN